MLYKSLHAKSSPACSVFTRRCLVRVLNNGDSPVSVLTSLLSGEYPTTKLYRHLFSASITELNSQLTGSPQLSSLYTMSTGGCFPRGKAAGAWVWPLIYIYSSNCILTLSSDQVASFLRVLNRKFCMYFLLPEARVFFFVFFLGPGAHPGSQPLDSKVSFPWDNAAMPWSQPLIFIWGWGYELWTYSANPPWRHA
jgi:hypothetical protein